MRGFGAFLGKELREIVRTWRIWVLPLIVLGMAALSPVTALVTPALLESVAGGQPGMSFEIPDPTTVDAYLQWTKNLAQIVLMAVIISMAGMLSGERKSGTAVLVLTKPVSRTAMVVAKFVGNSALLVGSVSAGAAACYGLTVLLFDGSLGAELAAATAQWLVLGLAFVALCTFLSAAIDSQAGSAGLGLVVYLAVAIASGWGPAREYSPAGLLTAPNATLLGEEVSLVWPVATGLAAAVALVGLAVLAFRRREL